jgi:CRISPR system Cascade subunit CasD
MATLLLRLVAPMQSWGTQSHFSMRDSGLEPSKSGVFGLFCAALGWPRSYPLDSLHHLKMGVRIDRPGNLQKDFHIVQDILSPDGKKIRKSSTITNRYYLSDAAFLVGLEGDATLLQQIQHAIQHPVWQIYLGRKAFVPSQPVWIHDGYRPEQSLLEALQDCGWISHPPEKVPETLLYVLEDRDGNQLRNDVPISFAERRFLSRRVSTLSYPAPLHVHEEVQV